LDGERLVRLEEQISGIGRDMAEVKNSIAAFLTSIGNMHKDYVPREEIEKQSELHAKQVDELELAIRKNSGDIIELREKWLSRPTWGVTMTFTGGGALIVGLITYVLTGHVKG